MSELPADSLEPIVVVGRGHSGTRVLSHTLFASGVFLGHRINPAGDTIPAKPMYDACRLVGEHVRWKGELEWDFDALHSNEIDPEFVDLVHTYLREVLNVRRRRRGWKLPETIMAYPWITRMFPDARYVHLVRDPRDCLLAPHTTDDLRRCNVEAPETDDELLRRVASWKYQHDIVKATPRPKHFVSFRFEDLVLDQESSMRSLEAFLEMPLARIVVDGTRVGRWESDRRVLPHIEPLEGAMRELGYL